MVVLLIVLINVPVALALQVVHLATTVQLAQAVPCVLMVLAVQLVLQLSKRTVAAIRRDALTDSAVTATRL